MSSKVFSLLGSLLGYYCIFYIFCLQYNLLITLQKKFSFRQLLVLIPILDEEGWLS